MRLRRTTAAALGLLALGSGLAACGDEAELEIGDVVRARQPDQFAEGKESSMVLPLGRLEVQLGDPVRTIAADQSFELTPATAPAGSTFVPITWQYDAGTFGAYAAYLGDPATPTFEVEADGSAYTVPPPTQAGEGSESFYVLVTGSADEISLAVDFDGERQSVDLRTGENDPGAAAPLYDLKPRSDDTIACAKPPEITGARGLGDYTCTITEPVRLPYAYGEWAEPREAWLVTTVESVFRRYDSLDAPRGGGAIYVPTDVRSAFRLGEEAPVATIYDEAVSGCNTGELRGCSATHHLVFAVGDKTPRRLYVEETYDAALGSKWGGFQGDEALTLEVLTTARTR